MRLLLLIAATCLFGQDTVIRTTVPLILVPVAVTDKHSHTINGLSESDFDVFDNGALVKHRLETTIQPIALVVAIQTSASAGPALAKIQKIGAIFEPLVVGEGGMAAIVTYSDQVTVLRNFTHNTEEFVTSVHKIEPDGDSRTDARMNDAVVESIEMLATRPNFRRILVVIGESRDRGSKATLQEAITKAQAANVTVYPVNYSVYKTSFTSRGDERFSSGRRVYDTDPGNLLAVFSEIGRLATENGGAALAKFTGGERLSFARLSGLERVVTKVGEDLHTQYLLNFDAGSVESGTYHRITVNVKRSEAVIRARPGYWVE
jgi:VWFA-related protein